MDPITLGLGVVGLGMQLFGGFAAADNAKQQSQVSSQITGEEAKINKQKQLQRQLESRRMQLQTIRNAQRARAQGESVAVNQGANLGSGLQGAKGQNTAEANFNLTGIGQAGEISNTIAGINQNISGYRQQLSTLGGEAATDQGIIQMGQAVGKIAPIAGAFGKDAMYGTKSSGSSNTFNPFNITGSFY